MPTRLVVPADARSQAARWSRGAAHLAAFTAQAGHARVPKRWVAPDGYRLGLWVAWQRQQERHGRLHPERRAALERAGFVWEPHRAREAALLRAALTAAATAPGTWAWLLDRRDARWLRTAHRRGRLSPVARGTLELLGFPWSASAAAFAHGLAMLAGYRAAGGAVPVRQSTRQDGYHLGAWVHRQRQLARSGRLAASRRTAIEALAPGLLAEGSAERRRTAERRIP